MFNRSRLTLARKRRGMTKVQLAEATGIATRTLTAYEGGERVPSPEVVEALVAALDFPMPFFFADDVDMPSPQAATFRAYSTMTAGQRDQALGAGGLTMELSEWIEERFRLPQLDLPDEAQHEPETAAAAVRAAWGLGQRPIRNMVHLLESRGVRVFSLSLDCLAVDAFSLWRDGVPYVFLNTGKSGERSRMDAAHELGHLVLHRDTNLTVKPMEDQARHFGAAFLMPKEDVIAQVTGLVTVRNLVTWKHKWNVSVTALAHRIHALGLINDWQYRLLCMQMGQRGYRKDEPEPSPRETSQLLAKVFDALRREGMTKRSIATELRIQEEDLESAIFGLVVMPMSERSARRA